MPKCSHVAVVANLEKKHAAHAAQALVEALQKRGIGVSGSEPLQSVLKSSIDRETRRADLIVSLGGDGTMLYTVREVAQPGQPVMGLNLGGLGFLTTAASSEVEELAEAIKAGAYIVDERLMVEASFEDPDGQSVVLESLNEIVVDEGAFTRRAVVLRTMIDGELLGTFTADGVVIASPTGSTAYSLSAGGPILHPSMKALVLTPVCPHDFSIRPYIFQSSQEVSITNLNTEASLKVTADGQVTLAVAPEGTVHIRASRRAAGIAYLEDRSFFQALRSKLEWGRSRKKLDDV